MVDKRKRKPRPRLQPKPPQGKPVWALYDGILGKWHCPPEKAWRVPRRYALQIRRAVKQYGFQLRDCNSRVVIPTYYGELSFDDAYIVVDIPGCKVPLLNFSRR